VIYTGTTGYSTRLPACRSRLGIAPILFTQVSSSWLAISLKQPQLKSLPNVDNNWLSRYPVRFVTDIIDIGVCPGFWINKKNGKVHSTGLQSPNIGYATLSHNALGIHDDTVSDDFLSEVIWIFCNHRNKKLK